MKKLCLLLAAAVAAALFFVAGCGGGGGGSAKVRGIANINYQTTAPKIAVVKALGDSIITVTSASMSRATSGWQDVNFSVGLPPDPGYDTIHVLVVYNDLNGDNVFSSALEILGYYSNRLYYRAGIDKWRIETVGGYVVYSDATACTGYDIYIPCEFARDVVMTPEQRYADLANMLGVAGE